LCFSGYDKTYLKKGEHTMNIQIFGKIKCQDTKKAERYFKERSIKFQFIDIIRYGISKGEYQSIKNAIGSIELLIDEKSKEYENKHIAFLSSDKDKEISLLETQSIFKTPIVRNGKQATVGYKPEIWKNWE
jgi:arsenate reductase-like glutaredoxin family protein